MALSTKHILSVLVNNQAGILQRVAGLFSRRGFNIDSLAVGETEDPRISRMTIVVTGDAHVVQQIQRQLMKLVDCIRVWDITERAVMRELALIKVKAAAQQRHSILEVVNIFRAKVVDISADSMTVECTGELKKILALVDMLSEYGILEMARTGAVALQRGAGDGLAMDS